MERHLLVIEEEKTMDRLTTDNRETNLQTLLNYAYAKDHAVYLVFGNDEDNIPLDEYIAHEACEHGCNQTAKSVMEGGCMECDCPIAILNAVSIQAAELRARLMMIEDILGDTYDLDRLRELMTADREGRLDVRPHFNVGDTIYVLIYTFNDIFSDKLEMRECTITGFRRGMLKQYATFRYWKGGVPFDSSVLVDDLGKTWFLSQEEAEAAIAKDNNVPTKEEENHEPF